MATVMDAVLRIGTAVGPGGFASIQSLIQMVGQLCGAVVRTVSELDKFAVVSRNVDMAIVNFADSAAKGQVDTFRLMQQLGAMNRAGIQVSKEGFAAISKAATEMAQSTGEGATVELERLTDAIIRGTSRGLVPYGIALKETTDKTEAQRMAMDLIIEKYGKTEIKLGTLSERAYSLSNSWGTLMGVLWEAVSQGDGPVSSMLDSLSEKIGNVAAGISEMPQAMRSYAASFQHMMDAIDIAINGSSASVDALNRAMSFYTGGRAGGDVFGVLPYGPSGPEMPPDIAEREKRRIAKMRSGDVKNTGGASTPDENIRAEAQKQLEEERKRKEKDAAVQEEIDFKRQEALSELLELALGNVEAVDFQIQREEKLLAKQEERLNRARELVRILGVEDTVNIDSEGISQPGVSEDTAYADKYATASEQVDLLYAQQEQLLQQQEEWDKTQSEFRQKVYQDGLAYQEMKNEAFEAELKWYGVRDQAIDQIMELDQLERQRVLNNLQDAERLVNSVNRLSSAWGTTKSAIMGVSSAYEKGTEGMTKAGAAFFYIDGIINVAKETAAAIQSAASYDYFSAALHTGSAIAYGVQVGLSASHGGGGGGASTKPPQMVASAGRYSGGYDRPESSGTNETTVIVTVDPTAVALGVLVDASDRAGRAGLPSFARAS